MIQQRSEGKKKGITFEGMNKLMHDNFACMNAEMMNTVSTEELVLIPEAIMFTHNFYYVFLAALLSCKDFDVTYPFFIQTNLISQTIVSKNYLPMAYFHQLFLN